MCVSDKCSKFDVYQIVDFSKILLFLLRFYIIFKILTLSYFQALKALPAILNVSIPIGQIDPNMFACHEPKVLDTKAIVAM